MTQRQTDTIVAPATVPGTGAISIIRLSGPQAISIASSLTSVDLQSLAANTAKFCTLSKGSEVIDDAVVTIWRAPHSYTGEDCVEISCHASSYIVQRVVLQLIDAGARSAAPGEFTQRAFLNGKMDLAQAESVADLISSQNAAAHKVAMNQMRGGFSKVLSQMRDELLQITSLMELELDFSEEEVEFADRDHLNMLLDSVLAHVKMLIDSFRLGNAIKNGVPVAIVGAANTGKSTLLNALVGEDRAIVSDIAGTTRDTIEETMIIDGVQYRFIDTAGIRESSDTVEKIGIQRTYEKLSQADIVLGILDGTDSPEAVISSLGVILSKVDFSSQKLLVLVNKMDKWGDNKNVNTFNKVVSFIENEGICTKVLPISSMAGNGLDSLKVELQVMQSDRVSSASSVLVTNARHFEALKSASTALTNVKIGLMTSVPNDLVSQDLREALYHLGTITGAISTDEVLGNIFQRFCIGK